MLVAILGNWGTHYDVAADPGAPAMDRAREVVLHRAVLPQLTIWLWFTFVWAGCSASAAALAGRGRTAS